MAPRSFPSPLRLGFLGVAALTASLAGAQEPTAVRSEPTAIQAIGVEAPAPRVADAPSFLRARDLLGRDVLDAAGTELGTIEDIVIDAKDGTCAYAIVAFGGFLGLGDRLYPVPFGALRPARGDTFLLDVSR
jgi:hypothetical protein